MKRHLVHAVLATALSTGLLAGTAATAEAVAPVTPKATSYGTDDDETASFAGVSFRITFGPGGRVKRYSVSDESDERVSITSRNLRAVKGRVSGASTYTASDGTRRKVRLSLRVVNSNLVVGSVNWWTPLGAKTDQVVLGTDRAWTSPRDNSVTRAAAVQFAASDIAYRLQEYRTEAGRYPTSLAGAQRVARTRLVTRYVAKDGGASYSMQVSTSKTPVYVKQSAGGSGVLAVR